MPKSLVKRPTLRVFALLAISFLIVGASVCGLLLSRALKNFRQETRRELGTLAQVIALQVDAEAHDKLTDDAQQDSPEYNAQIERLDQALQLTTDIRFVYTLRKVEGEFYFVLDPTPPGDADGDGVDDKSYLLEPYPDITPEALKAYRTGTVQVDAEPYADAWGVFLSGYAPIKNRAGSVVAILGVDRDYGVVLASEKAIWNQALGALLLVLALSLVVSWVLAVRLSLRAGDPPLRPSIGRGIIRSTSFEVMLYALVCTLTVGGILGQVEAARDVEAERKLGRSAALVQNLRNEIDGVLLGDKLDAAGVSRLAYQAQNLGLPALANSFKKCEAQLIQRHKGWDTTLRSALGSIEGLEQSNLSHRDEVVERLEHRSNLLLALFAMSTVLTLGALVLIRAAARQQSDLEQLVIENGEKNREVSSKNLLLSQALQELEENLAAMVTALVKAVEAKDHYTAGHSERVMQYSLQLGREVGLSERELKILEMGTLIHDIGKIGVPDELLTKPTSLTPEEFAIIKTHPEVGFRMIEGIPMFQECAPIVRWHHERLDGSGYPDGLAGDEISLLVRIAAVADSFDAMISTRAYRQGLTLEVALNELVRGAEEGKLDATLVKAMVRITKSNGSKCDDLQAAA